MVIFGDHKCFRQEGNTAKIPALSRNRISRASLFSLNCGFSQHNWTLCEGLWFPQTLCRRGGHINYLHAFARYIPRTDCRHLNNEEEDLALSLLKDKSLCQIHRVFGFALTISPKSKINVNRLVAQDVQCYITRWKPTV
jgi:hypothetical protein